MTAAGRAGRELHLHLYYSQWTHESRAWRAGAAALRNGFATRVIYAGCLGLDQHGAELPEQTQLAPAELIERLPPTPVAPGGSKWRRALRLPSWWWNAFRRYGSRKDVGVVVAHSLASLPLAVLLKMRTGATLLYDAHELETHREGWSASIRLFAQVAEWLLIGFADQTLVVNESIRDWYRKRYPSVPLTTVRNIPDARPLAHRSDQLRRDAGLGEDDLICVYLGVFVEGRGIEETAKAFETTNPNTHVVFVGFGPLEARLKGIAETVPNVHVLPAVPSGEVLSYASGADIGISLIRGASLSYRLCLPNKVFEYALAGLAVVVSDLPEQRRFVEETGRGWVIPGHSAALADLLAGLDRESVTKMIARSELVPVLWEDEVEKLLDVYRALTGKTDREASSPPQG